MNAETSRIVAALDRSHGIDLSAYAEDFLARSIARRREAIAAPSGDAYVRRLEQDPGEAEALFQALNIGYSEFFREPLTFAVIERLVLPQLILDRQKAGQTELRVWSAGCAAGQEAFSLALLLDDATASPNLALDFRIFATDRSAASLATAGEAVYDADALANVRLRHLRRHFTQEEAGYRVNPTLRARVVFSPYDLLDDRTRTPPGSVYGNFDLVLCGNLLFYYGPEARRAILRKLRESLADAGYLVTGETERAFAEDCGGLRAVMPPAAVFQKLG